MDVSFSCFCLDATELSKFTEDALFDRIETSNIADAGWLGTFKTIACFGKLLKPLSVNPHATLIILYMNAVPETATKAERRADLDRVFKQLRPLYETRLGLQHLRDAVFTSGAMNSAPMLFITGLGDLVCAKEKIFERY